MCRRWQVGCCTLSMRPGVPDQSMSTNKTKRQKTQQLLEREKWQLWYVDDVDCFAQILRKCGVARTDDDVAPKLGSTGCFFGLNAAAYQ